MTGSRALLLLLRQPPYASANPLEALDVAAVAAAFEWRVSLLFQGNGVWQLLRGQDGASLGMPTHAAALAALPDYEVERFYVCADSLAAAGLTLADLILPAVALSPAEQRSLIASQDVVVTD